MFESAQGIIKPIVYVGIVKEGKLLLLDYKKAPNPDRKGWWIPAPGLEYGGDPEKKALATAKDLGIEPESIYLIGTESFKNPGGWHILFHFRITTKSELMAHPNVNAGIWLTSKELGLRNDIAHGTWEISLGQDFLGKK